MIPAVAFGGPQDFTGVAEKTEEGFAGVDIMLGCFADDNFLFSGFGIDSSQFHRLVATLAIVVVKAFAVGKPNETGSALKLHFKRRGFYIDSPGFPNVENNRLRLWENFSRERINDRVCLGSELIGRNELEVSESAGAARVHAIGGDF